MELVGRPLLARVPDDAQVLEPFPVFRVSAITMRREPLSGGALARETVEVIYAGYLSAATGRRVDLARP